MAGSRLTEGQRPLAAICVFVVCLGLWNAARYPTGAGYDAGAHMAYADGLVPGLAAAAPSATGRRVLHPAGLLLRRRRGRLAPRADGLRRSGPRRAGRERRCSCSGRCCSSRRSRASSGPVAGGSSSGRPRSSRSCPSSSRRARCSIPSRCRSSSPRSRSGSACGRSSNPRYAWALGVDARRRPARARLGARDGRGGRARAARRTPLARARRRVRARGGDPGALVHPPAHDLRRPAAVPAAGAGDAPPRRRSGTASGSRRSSRRRTARTTTPGGSRSPTTASGATTSASGPGTRTASSVTRPSTGALGWLRLQSLLGLVPTLSPSSAGCSSPARRCAGRRRSRSRSCRSSVLRPTSTSPSATGHRRRPAQGDLHADDGRRLGARLRVRARPPSRPLVDGDGGAARRSSRSPSCRSSSTEGRACPRGSGRARAAGSSRARPRSGSGRRRSPAGRTAG